MGVPAAQGIGYGSAFTGCCRARSVLQGSAMRAPARGVGSSSPSTRPCSVRRRLRISREGPRVCRLPAGAKGIRTAGPTVNGTECGARRLSAGEPASEGWDLEFESGLLQQRVCELSVPEPMTGTFARPSAIWFAENLMGLMVMAMLFGELFGGAGANPPDLQALADQHARAVVRGLRMPETGKADERRAPPVAAG